MHSGGETVSISREGKLYLSKVPKSPAVQRHPDSDNPIRQIYWLREIFNSSSSLFHLIFRCITARWSMSEVNIGKWKHERGGKLQKEVEGELVLVVEEEEEKSKFEGSDDENALPRIGALCHWETWDVSRYDCVLEFPAKSPLRCRALGGGGGRRWAGWGIIALRHQIQGIIICISVA